MGFLDNIPIGSTAGFIGLALLILGGFMVLAGFDIIRIEKVTVRQGRTTWVVGIIFAAIGLVLLLPDLAPSPDVAQLDAPSEGLPTTAATHTPLSTSTPTPSLTPTSSVTSSPRPTKTPTPQPEWVTGFSQPILAAIESLPPKFQDDFDDKSGGWQRENWCGEWRMKYQDGELVLTSCGARRANMDYPEFVAKFDGHFLPDTKGDASWAIFFRDIGGPSYMFGVNYDGSVGLWGFENEYRSFSSAAISGYKTNHLLLIAKGSEFAFYVNDKPLYYLRDDKYRWGDIWFRAWGGGSPNITDNPTIAAFDNLMIWDISDISIP